MGMLLILHFSFTLMPAILFNLAAGLFLLFFAHFRSMMLLKARPPAYR